MLNDDPLSSTRFHVCVEQSKKKKISKNFYSVTTHNLSNTRSPSCVSFLFSSSLVREGNEFLSLSLFSLFRCDDASQSQSPALYFFIPDFLSTRFQVDVLLISSDTTYLITIEFTHKEAKEETKRDSNTNDPPSSNNKRQGQQSLAPRTHMTHESVHLSFHPLI